MVDLLLMAAIGFASGFFACVPFAVRYWIKARKEKRRYELAAAKYRRDQLLIQALDSVQTEKWLLDVNQALWSQGRELLFELEYWRREAIKAREALRIERWQHLESIIEAESLFHYGSTTYQRMRLVLHCLNFAGTTKLIALLNEAGVKSKEPDEEAN